MTLLVSVPIKISSLKGLRLVEADLVYKHYVPSGTLTKKDDLVSTNILSLTGHGIQDGGTLKRVDV